MAGIHLKNNPWVMPPEAVVEAGLEALHMFLVDAEKASEVGSAVQRRRLLKVVLVGAASAGKTRCGRSVSERLEAFTDMRHSVHSAHHVGVWVRCDRVVGNLWSRWSVRWVVFVSTPDLACLASVTAWQLDEEHRFGAREPDGPDGGPQYGWHRAATPRAER